jgi:hypothetical protein
MDALLEGFMSALKYAYLLVVAPVLLVSSRPCAAQDVPANATASERTELVEGNLIHQIQADLVDEKFDALDRSAAQLRSEKTRVPGGGWKLTHFYEALDKPLLADKDSIDHLEHLRHWVAQRPESITARVALATSLHRWAWVARGNGMANTVTADGWRLFDERIKESYTVLQDAANLHEQCPGWYSEMMIVGLAQSWDRPRMEALFQQAIQFEPGYFRFYKQFANYLLPKWDGKGSDAIAFAKEAANNVGGEAGDQVYFHIAMVVVGKNGPEFGVKEMDWERIQRGYQSLTAQYGTNGELKNEIAFLAWKFHDAEFARQQFELIGDHWSRSVWRDRERFDRARDWSRNHG